VLGIRHYRNVAIDLFQGDITGFVCDVMVNAADQTLASVGGVSGAIHRAGGPEILEECRKIGSCETGQAIVTTAGRLPAQIVIHAVGPGWKDGNQGEASLLAAAYRNTLQLASEASCPHVSIPSLSTGACNYPIAKAASIAMSSVKEFLEQQQNLRRITFVLFSIPDYQVYQKALFDTFLESNAL